MSDGPPTVRALLQWPPAQQQSSVTLYTLMSGGMPRSSISCSTSTAGKAGGTTDERGLRNLLLKVLPLKRGLRTSYSAFLLWWLQAMMRDLTFRCQRFASPMSERTGLAVLQHLMICRKVPCHTIVTTSSHQPGDALNVTVGTDQVDLEAPLEHVLVRAYPRETPLLILTDLIPVTDL
jgi:hypothetical protein